MEKWLVQQVDLVVNTFILSFHVDVGLPSASFLVSAVMAMYGAHQNCIDVTFITVLGEQCNS
jgi:hypothetical protein